MHVSVLESDSSEVAAFLSFGINRDTNQHCLTLEYVNVSLVVQSLLEQKDKQKTDRVLLQRSFRVKSMPRHISAFPRHNVFSSTVCREDL